MSWWPRLLTLASIVPFSASSSPIPATSGTSPIAASPTTSPLWLDRSHLWLVLGCEGGDCLVQVDGGRDGGDADLLGGEENFVGGLENTLVSLNRKFHIADMCSYIYWNLKGPQSLSCACTATPIQFPWLFADIVNDLIPELGGQPCHRPLERLLVRVTGLGCIDAQQVILDVLVDCGPCRHLVENQVRLHVFLLLVR